MKRWLLAALLLAAFPVCAAPLHEGGWPAVLLAHAGQPVIVHVWGMTCAPCQVELPEWGKLRQERPSLALVLVEADPMPVKPERIGAVLAKAGLADAESWVLEDADERQRYEIDPAWGGELPMTLLIGRDGKTVRILGAADFNVVRQWLDTAG
ncbi:MAG TPA: TlpA disulfide reductase family protein [Patescibacteria group bacterium]|nr:TlpA disulfide reductase family protein [Patescibacteria group bacterium]